MLLELDMDDVFTLYQQRVAVHRELVHYLKTENIDGYEDLALGISRSEGNYSAAEHGLGPQVLYHNSRGSVFALAQQLYALRSAHHLPETIYRANLPYLRISIGSEIAMMLKPDEFWVGNTRTIYTHLMLKHDGNRERADEELRLYREPDGRRPSEMEYKIWRDLYLSLESSLKSVASIGSMEAQEQSTQVGQHVYMWADAISSYVYSLHA